MDTKLELRSLLNLPPALIKALGKVSARYGQIEHLLALTIHRTTELSYEDAFTEVGKRDYWGNKKKCRKVKQAFRRWAVSEWGQVEGGARSEVFSSLIGIWAARADDRDDVTHCCWSGGLEDRNVTGTRNGELLERDGRPYTIEDVEKLAEDLKQLVIRLNDATLPRQQEGSTEKLVAPPVEFSDSYKIPAGDDTSSTAVTVNILSRNSSGQ